MRTAAFLVSSCCFPAHYAAGRAGTNRLSVPCLPQLAAPRRPRPDEVKLTSTHHPVHKRGEPSLRSSHLLLRCRVFCRVLPRLLLICAGTCSALRAFAPRGPAHPPMMVKPRSRMCLEPFSGAQVRFGSKYNRNACSWHPRFGSFEEKFRNRFWRQRARGKRGEASSARVLSGKHGGPGLLADIARRHRLL